MRPNSVWKLLLGAGTILAVIGQQVNAIEPITTGIVTGVALVGGLYKWGEGFYCYSNECPTDKWITNNLTKTELLLEENVFGQHLVRTRVLRALRSHLRKSRTPSKALTMSFHGWTGSGKNYVARFIAEGLYSEGMRSKFVHLFMATLHFPHKQKSDEYKLELQDWIRSNVSSSPQHLFIFDEIDKMPEGVIDAIKPFIDHHETIQGVDYRRSIFIFLSNTGGQAITERTLELWEEGKQREELRYDDYEDLINIGAFNEHGGLRKSTLLERSLVDHLVPFLPLEREHVRKCVETEAKNRLSDYKIYRDSEKNLKASMKKNIGALLESDIERVLDQMHYWPNDSKLFSTTGCKRVYQKVGQILEEYFDDL